MDFPQLKISTSAPLFQLVSMAYALISLSRAHFLQISLHSLLITRHVWNIIHFRQT